MNELNCSLREEMRKVLKPARYEHTLGVAYTAWAIAVAYGIDAEKALTAGLLHDCTKGLSHEEQLRICKEGQITLSDAEKEIPALLHAKTGAYVARMRYGITDEEILDAIRSHTTGRPGMGLLEKIIYLADFIEPNRAPLKRHDAIRRMVFRSLDEALVMTLENVTEYLRSTGAVIDPVTEQTFLYYSNEMNGRARNDDGNHHT